MKKAREFWLNICRKGFELHTEWPPKEPTLTIGPIEVIHVREVLDADPKDEIIKTMRDALKNTFDCLPDELARPKNFCREALAAVEKLEKDK